MRYHALLWLPLALIGAFALAWVASPEAARAPLVVVEVESAKVLALLGCVLAALAFERGDYLRRAWMLLGACTLLLFARDAVALAAPQAQGARAFFALQGALATAGNASSIAGTWLLARAWNVAGLDEEGTASRGRMMLIGAAALALLVTGWPLVGDLRALGGGDLFAVVPLASDIADTAVIALLAPLLRTTIALRGGVLRWPWALLVASGALWLVYDAAYAMVARLHEPGRGHAIGEALRALPTLYTFSAGLAQRWAVSERALIG